MVSFNLFFSLQVLVCRLVARFLVWLFLILLFVPLCVFAAEKSKLLKYCVKQLQISSSRKTC